MHNKEDYRKVKKELIELLKKNGIEYITTYCSFSALPLIPAYEFVKEDFPEKTQWCDDNIKRLKEFYGYK